MKNARHPREKQDKCTIRKFGGLFQLFDNRGNAVGEMYKNIEFREGYFIGDCTGLGHFKQLINPYTGQKLSFAVGNMKIKDGVFSTFVAGSKWVFNRNEGEWKPIF